MSLDERTFAELSRRHRRELQVHCYRMLGSFVESEDLVQETFLRAWRRRETFAGRSTARAWLYRIATNACLDTLAKRPPRVLPPDVTPAVGPAGPPPAPAGVLWLEPYPDALLEGIPGAEGPDNEVVDRETIELAFMAAIQHLPPKQRAVLILRDVLGWSANETAEVLEDTVTAVKSALARARGTMKQRLPRSREDWTVADPTEEETAVLSRYMAAHERDDSVALAAVLAEDVRVSYPPMGLWVDGREAFIAGSREHAAAGEYRFVATRANQQPATAIYLRPPGAPTFRLLVLEVLRIEAGRVVEIIDFGMPELLAGFGLPQELT